MTRPWAAFPSIPVSGPGWRKAFDVGQGRTTLTGVAMIEYRYDVPFKFTGKIDKLTFKLEQAQHTGANPGSRGV